MNPGVCSAVTQSAGAHGSGVEDSGIPVSLKGAQGGSVWFHVIRNPELPPEVELEKISWGNVSRANYIVMLHVFPGRDVPEWVNFQDKFEKRVHVLNITTLRIDNLTLEDSGRYRARVGYRRGRQYDQDFRLRVYEPVPLPQIRGTVLSLTPAWCNVTVECDANGTREDLTVTWESEGLSRELEQRPAPGPAPNPWTMAVNLPPSQPSTSLTCVVSNQVDQKTATRDLGDVCGHGECILPEGRGSPGAQAALAEGSVFCPPCLCHPRPPGHSIQDSGCHIQHTPAFLSVPPLFLPTPHPCWSKQHPAGTSPHPHPSFLV
ncbi:SLAM family member 5-like isoform X2 [Eumetopias jubatus]|uniref:SLAM family member 5-like isoform X2 n=1 Tax=Eumetopias jubatus TaxID=34886 RepID=UPI00101656BE|nr:SLAM family member 5-like isoform X2 [Eumetopias jubatus]XP_027952940.1 SLAM family member 5-like isoform X2 [Eumetopias jubatus]